MFEKKKNIYFSLLFYVRFLILIHYCKATDFNPHFDTDLYILLSLCIFNFYQRDNVKYISGFRIDFF